MTYNSTERELSQGYIIYYILYFMKDFLKKDLLKEGAWKILECCKDEFGGRLRKKSDNG